MIFVSTVVSIHFCTQGVRRSTLMKKFGGLFAAEGMLDDFQIEICDSLDNPLQYFATEAPAAAATTTTPSRTRSTTLTRDDVGDGRSTAAAPNNDPPATRAVPSRQLALMCHKFSTKITLRDVVGFGRTEGPKVRTSLCGVDDDA